MSLVQNFDKHFSNYKKTSVYGAEENFQIASSFLMPLKDDQLLEITAHIFSLWPGREVTMAMSMMSWVFTMNHHTELNLYPLRAAISDYLSPFHIMRLREVPREIYETVEKEYLRLMKDQAERKVFYSREDTQLVEFNKLHMAPLLEKLKRYNLNYEMGEL